MDQVRPFKLCRGPRQADVAIVGEAPGAEEELKGIPFVGTSGRFLMGILKQVGFDPKQVFITNVLTQRPPGNRIEEFCVGRSELPKGYPKPALSSGKYLAPQYLPELDRLAEELRQVRPKIIIGLGATAAWALHGTPKIGSVRGTWFYEELTGESFKTILTYHPAGVLRQWKLRVDFILDLEKAFAGRKSPKIDRPNRTLLLSPTKEELIEVKPKLMEADWLVVDIETRKGQIDCIGFAPSQDFAVSIPFFSVETLENFWQTEEDEIWAWRYVRDVLTSPSRKIFQNGMYDLTWLIGRYKIPVRNAGHDSMLLAHSLYPERPKGLADLAAIYTDEVGWKAAYRRKKDEEKED